MRKFSLLLSLAAICLSMMTSCVKETENNIPAPVVKDGLFVINEGSFQYSTASLTYYDPENNEAINDMFYRANGMKLGSVAQSMTAYKGKGWIVVNNSHVIFAVDLNNVKEVGRIENLTSPRNICFVNDKKAYVTNLYDNRIAIIDPTKYTVTGYITVPGMEASTGSTEQMVVIGRYAYCTCWSFQKSIIKIDTQTDQVVDKKDVGVQPQSLVVDKNGKLWTLCDGGYQGNPIGYEAPTICRINPETLAVEQTFSMNLGDYPGDMVINGDGDTLYWINGSVWSMPITATAMPTTPLVANAGNSFYSMTVNPRSGEVYVSDAVDYTQAGMVYRYSPQGKLIDKFGVGVCPGAFCWK